MIQIIPVIAPERIELIGDEVGISWKDGSEDYYQMNFLRAASPSADTAGEKDLLGNVYGGEGKGKFEGVKVLGWSLVGGYAILFRFSDGHETGIYSFDYLKRLSRLIAEHQDDGPAE